MMRGSEFLIIVAAFGVPAIILLPVVHLSTSFTASLRTKSFQFTTAPWQNSAGLFNSDELPLDLTVEGSIVSSPASRRILPSPLPSQLHCTEFACTCWM
jgi:hypothetical protein